MELRVGRGRVGLLLASSSVVALLVGAGSEPARAACTAVTGASAGFTNPVGVTIDCVTVSNANVTGGIVNNGTINTVGNLTALHITTGATIGGAVVNTGTIKSPGNGIVQDNGSIAGGVTNTGSIMVAESAILVGSSTAGASFTGGITNSGTISISLNSFEDIRVGGNPGFAFASFAGGINNSKLLAGGNTGIVVLFVSNFSGGISNGGTISAAQFGIGMGFSCAQAACPGGTVTSFSGGITNTGTIAAPIGVLVQSVSAFSGDIVNTGNMGEIVVTGTATFAGAISNAGTITGNGGTAIDVSGVQTAMTINQSAGLITGDIKLSAHADVLNITGGTVSGNVIGQGSSNTVNFSPGTGNTFTYASGFGVSGVNQININSGTVILNGTNSATNVDVLGGTLAGTGTIDPAAVTIHAGAVFAPGTPGVAGSSMAITGNIVFQPGATYAVSVSPATASFATISGTATLAGNVVAAFAPGSYLTKDYLILQSSGLRGTFAGLTTSAVPAGFMATLAYNGDDVFLDLASSLTTSGLNVNQANVASTLLNVFNGGGALPPGFVNVLGLTGVNQANALSALSGEPAADAQKGAFQLMDDFLVLMLDTSLDGRGSTGGPLPFAPDQPAALPPEVASAYASVLKAPPRPTFDQRWSAWGSAFGGYNSTKGDPAVGSNDVIARDYGFAAGMDYRVAPDTVLGFALAGAGTNWGLAQGLGGGRSDAFQAGLYGRTQMGAAYVAGALAFANHWFTTNRTVLADQLTAKFDGQSYAARLEGGWRYAAAPTLGITPYAALQSQLFRTPAYSETDLTGGGFGLAYDAMSATDTRSELGARADSLAVLGGTPLILRGRLAWAHDWVSNPAIGAAFAALPGSAFTVNGAAPPKNSALTAASAELELSPAWSATVKFEGDFGAGTQTYTGTGVLRYTW